MKVDRTGQFEELRRHLFPLADRMLGTRADAEDVVQEAFLRWLNASDEEIRMPKPFLMTVVSRLSLDALKSAQRKRKVYTGQWLPEPLVEPLGAQFDQEMHIQVLREFMTAGGSGDPSRLAELLR